MSDNIFTIDLEEYYHSENIPVSLDEKDKLVLSSRLSIGVDRILDLLERYDSCATFFVLGCVAEKNKKLIEKISGAGHEIASHGYQHIPLYKHTAVSFGEDLKKSTEILHGITGQAVIGYRAPLFSLSRSSPWFFDVLKKNKIVYDSSLALSLFRRNPITSKSDNGVIELGASFLRMGPLGLPLGGGYFRAYPYFLTRWAAGSLIRRGTSPFVFYIHPRELDPEQPRYAASPIGYLRQYLNLKSTGRKLEALLSDMRFISAREYLNKKYF